MEQPAFIYALSDPNTGSVRYVGKSVNPQWRKACHIKEKGNTRKNNWLTSLKRNGQKPVLTILAKTDSSQWQEEERRWIAYFRAAGEDLTNHTSGGEGLHNPSTDTRQKIAQLQRARMADPSYRAKCFTPERNAKLSAALKGKSHRPEHIAKLPQNQPGWHHTEEAKARIRASAKGHRWSSEEIAVLRQDNLGNTYGFGNRSRKGQVQSEEERKKKSEATQGRPKGESHKARIREGQLRAWARRKAIRDAGENSQCQPISRGL